MRQKTRLHPDANFSALKHHRSELVKIMEAELSVNKFLFTPAPDLAEATDVIGRRLCDRVLTTAAAAATSLAEVPDGGTRHSDPVFIKQKAVPYRILLKIKPFSSNSCEFVQVKNAVLGLDCSAAAGLSI